MPAFMLSWRHQISWLRAPLMSLCELHVLVYSRCAVTLLQRLLYLLQPVLVAPSTRPNGLDRCASWILDLVDQVWELRRGEESWGWLRGGEGAEGGWEGLRGLREAEGGCRKLKVEGGCGGAYLPFYRRSEFSCGLKNGQTGRRGIPGGPRGPKYCV